MSTVAAISEIALLLLRAYMLAARQAGLTEEQAKEEFISMAQKFMLESEKPVDEVKK